MVEMVKMRWKKVLPVAVAVGVILGVLAGMVAVVFDLPLMSTLFVASAATGIIVARWVAQNSTQ